MLVLLRWGCCFEISQTHVYGDTITDVMVCTPAGVAVVLSGGAVRCCALLWWWCHVLGYSSKAVAI